MRISIRRGGASPIRRILGIESVRFLPFVRQAVMIGVDGRRQRTQFRPSSDVTL
jgi:hypothetical protein